MIDILRVPLRYKNLIDRLPNEDKGYIFGTLLSMCSGEETELRDDNVGDLVSLIFRDCNMIYEKATVGKQYGHLGGEYGKLGGRPKKPPRGDNEKPPTPFLENPRIEEKRIEKKDTDTNTSNFLLGAKKLGYGEKFMETLSLFINHRKEIRKRLTPTSFEMILEKFRKNGEKDSIQAMTTSIEKGWQGLFFNEQGYGKKSTGAVSSEGSYSEEV